MTRYHTVRNLILALTALCLQAAAPASAQVCRGAADTINFGTIDLTANIAYDTSASVRVTCSGTAGQTVRVCPNIGAGSGGADNTGDPRYMLNGGNQLNYNLFQDAGRTTVWGSYAVAGNPPAIDVSLDAGGTGHASVPIYGRVYAGQGALPAATYTSVFDGSQSSMSYAYSTGQTCTAIGAAHQTPTPFAVTANDTNTCTITASALNFGNIAETSAPVTSSATLTVMCTLGTAYTISLNGGLTGASNPVLRKMLSGSNQLTYGLYSDNGLSQPWGETAGTNTVGGTGDGTSHAIPVYGRVPTQTTPPPATYRDYVIATVTY